MPTKKTAAGREYSVSGKKFTWVTEDGAEVVIPMRVKLGLIRKMADRDLDPGVMFEMLEAIAPGQADTLDEMDVVTDFQPMFETWQAEYNALAGATPGE